MPLREDRIQLLFNETSCCDLRDKELSNVVGGMLMMKLITLKSCRYTP